MTQLILVIIPAALMAMPLDAAAACANDHGAATESRGSVVTKSSGDHRKDETLMAQSNDRSIRTDHAALAAKLTRKKHHNSSFWDGFYSTENISLWVPVNYKDTPRRREVYRQMTGAPSDSLYMQYLQHYQRRHKYNHQTTNLDHQDQDYAEWLYIMYRIDLGGLVGEAN